MFSEISLIFLLCLLLLKPEELSFLINNFFTIFIKIKNYINVIKKILLQKFNVLL